MAGALAEEVGGDSDSSSSSLSSSRSLASAREPLLLLLLLADLNSLAKLGDPAVAALNQPKVVILKIWTWTRWRTWTRGDDPECACEVPAGAATSNLAAKWASEAKWAAKATKTAAKWATKW